VSGGVKHKCGGQNKPGLFSSFMRQYLKNVQDTSKVATNEK